MNIVKSITSRGQWLLLLSLLIMACSDEDWKGTGGNMELPINLSGEIDQVMKTRVADSGFCNGDEMGVYIVDYDGTVPGTLANSGNRATNLKYTFDEVNYKWTPAYDVYWKDNVTPVDIYGYYPYSSPGDVSAYTFEVQKNQQKSAEGGALGGYEASDFLWGKAEKIAPTQQVVKLALRHRMANARVVLQEGDGFAEGEWGGFDKSVLVMNTKRSAVINLSTGVIEATGEVASTGIIAYRNSDEFRAIVVPQTLGASTVLFSLTVNGVNYTFKKDADFEYMPGKMHNFTIKVDKKTVTGDYEFTVVDESITAWENDGVSHDATAREYIVIESEAGKLKEAIKAAGKDFCILQNLKITGKICSDDFYFMCDSMNRLQALNLKEVVITKGTYEDSGAPAADRIPTRAFADKVSLLKLVLPDKLKVIGTAAFDGCSYLSGSLIVPEGVTRIEASAFNGCKALTGTLSLPSTLEYIGGGQAVYGLGAFRGCGFVGELHLPVNLKYIGMQAFLDCSGLYGDLHLPDALTYLGDEAFQGCKNLTGNLTIPQGVIEISGSAFRGCGFNGTLTLHDGVTAIGSYAFYETPLKGELELPKDLIVLNDNVFNGCDFSGTLVLPKNLSVIGDNAFAYNWRLTGVLEIPEKVQSIGAGAFAGCRGIEGLILPEALESIRYESMLGDNGGAFSNCFGIGSIICKGTIPPYIQSGAFNGVSKDIFTVEVPEPSVTQYQVAPGWSDFKRIAAHRELVCRPALACAINTECTRKLVLNAEGDWEVESKPDWCKLSAMSGNKKTELTLTISEMPSGSAQRSGEIVFRLTGKDYTSKCAVTQYDYKYAEDEVITLHKATKGNNGGINLVFLGDGYDAKDISDGTYMKDMEEQVDNFFGIEPYKTYKDYFNVYTAIAVSPESGIGSINTIRYAKFETTYTGGVGLRCDYDAAFAYACKMPTVNKENLNQSLIIITPNSTDYGGICQMWDDGSAIAFCPKSAYGYPLDTRGVIQHEAGGHGFGKLGDEYIYHNEFIDFCTCTCCGHVFEFNAAKANGWYDNLSLTGKMNEVPWSHLIFDSRYSDVVDIFEGGFMHTRGVYRSEQNSCMNNDIPYYSTVSRESIVKRIMRYAGEDYSFDKFVANDKVDNTTAKSLRSVDTPWGKNSGTYQHEPVIHKGKPAFLRK